MKIDIIAVGSLRKGALFDALNTYQERIHWPVNFIICESKHRNEQSRTHEEHHKILNALSKQAYVIAMDERGKSIPSLKFAHKIQELQNQGNSHFQFILGGANGLSDEIRSRSNFLLSFGAQTWPHMLARVMLLEQIYRCQQILNDHPYHRE